MKAHQVLVTFVAAAVVFFLVTMGAQADEKTYYAKDGPYVGLSAVNNSVGGSDFDGDQMQVGIADAFLVPDVDSDWGFGLLLGTRAHEWAFELGYMRSTHDATSSAADVGDAAVNIVDLNVKYHFLSDRRLQPYLLFGMDVSWITVEDAAIDLFDLSVSDATFVGVGINVGAGVAYYFTPQLALTGGAIYRGISFTDVEGYDPDSLNASILTYGVGLTYTF